VEAMMKIREAVASRDPKSIALAAHALKGSSATVGAERVRKSASQLEKVGWSKNLAGAETVLSALEESFAELQPVLKSFAEKSRTQAAD
jgi:HPt (histidine-containing phosphotransfer) domain-containing protein